MLKKSLQISGTLTAFLLFLSITINDKPVFSYVYDLISPVTKYAQNHIQSFFNKSLDTSETYSKKIFANSVPHFNDSVRSKLASGKRTAGAPLENIELEDKQELDQLIKNH
jgi:hypothetical protein